MGSGTILLKPNNGPDNSSPPNQCHPKPAQHFVVSFSNDCSFPSSNQKGPIKPCFDILWSAMAFEDKIQVECFPKRHCSLVWNDLTTENFASSKNQRLSRKSGITQFSREQASNTNTFSSIFHAILKVKMCTFLEPYSDIIFPNFKNNHVIIDKDINKMAVMQFFWGSPGSNRTSKFTEY